MIVVNLEALYKSLFAIFLIHVKKPSRPGWKRILPSLPLVLRLLSLVISHTSFCFHHSTPLATPLSLASLFISLCVSDCLLFFFLPIFAFFRCVSADPLSLLTFLHSSPRIDLFSFSFLFF